MAIIFFAGSVPGSGVTSTIAGLAHEWRKSGKSVHIIKPFTLNADSPDSESSLFNSEIKQHQLYHEEAQLGKVKDQILGLSKSADITLVEGLPILNSEGTEMNISAKLASAIGAKVIGVQHFLNINVDASLGLWRKFFGEKLIGIFVNRVPPDRAHFAANALNRTATECSIDLLSVIPEDRTMVSPSVIQIADHLSAKFSNGPPHANPLVENFLIGGLLMEWGGNYFGRFPKQGVIIRSGRIDIQMSALNFPMSCMLLTTCMAPQQYVQQRAQAQGVPLMFVEETTMDVANSLESIVKRVNAHHPEKITRFSQLLLNNTNINALIQAG